MSQRNRAGREAPIRALPALLALLVGAGPPAVRPARAEEQPPVAVRSVAVAPEGVAFDVALPEPLPEAKLQALDAGESVGVTWELEVVRDRKLWFNTTVERREVESTALYDPLTRRYTLERRVGRDVVSSREAGAREEALTWLERLDGFVVPVPAEKLAKSRLRWRARAVLGRKLVMLFVPATVSTKWARGALPDSGGADEPEADREGEEP